MAQKEEWKGSEEVKLEGCSHGPWLSLSWDPDETKV